MPRAPVLPSVVKYSGGGKPRYAGPSEGPPDGYAERLVKYIPGETVAFFLPLASIKGFGTGRLVALLIIAEIGTIIWMVNRNQRLPSQRRRPLAMVVLWSLIAVFAWTLGTSPAVQSLFDWPALTCTLVLASSAFLIPALDEMLTRYYLESKRSD